MIKLKYIFIIIIVIILTLSTILIKDKQVENLKYLEYHYTTGNALNSDVLYKIECHNKCILTIKKENISLAESLKVELTNKELKDIESILNKYKVSKWNNYNKSNKHVLDGNSFNLYIKYSNKNISARGYMKYPRNYHKFKKEIDSYVKKYIKK